jgi:hypothetical protein
MIYLYFSSIGTVVKALPCPKYKPIPKEISAKNLGDKEALSQIKEKHPKKTHKQG